MDLKPPGPLHLQEETNLPKGFFLLLMMLSGTDGRSRAALE